MMTVAGHETTVKSDAACAGSVGPQGRPGGHTNGQKVLDSARRLASQRHHQRRGQLLRGPLPWTDDGVMPQPGEPLGLRHPRPRRAVGEGRHRRWGRGGARTDRAGVRGSHRPGRGPADWLVGMGDRRCGARRHGGSDARPHRSTPPRLANEVASGLTLPTSRFGASFGSVFPWGTHLGLMETGGISVVGLTM